MYKNYKTILSISLLIVLATLSSCSNQETLKPHPSPTLNRSPQPPKGSSDPTTSTSNGVTYTLKNPKPIPTPTKIYRPSLIDSKYAKFFLTTKELAGFTVSNPPDIYKDGPQLQSEKQFYTCNGPQAHPLAKGPIDGQVAGDHYYKHFGPNLQVITSSSYFPTTTGKEFLEYISDDKTHEKCLIEFMQRFKGNASNTQDLKQEVISFKDNLLITRLTASDTPIKPGLNFYMFYTYSDSAVLSYTANVMGYNTPERADLSKKIIDLISKAILEKIKLT